MKNKILLRAQKTLLNTNLLIEHCGSWLSAEEGNEYMMKKIMEKKRMKEKKRNLN
ncbi:MAG: hypothetical protein LBC84_10120 [Prevotellaceae bacterium]|nr:hypothetical protein [Prevotellaceae bacterium]